MLVITNNTANKKYLVTKNNLLNKHKQYKKKTKNYKLGTKNVNCKQKLKTILQFNSIGVKSLTDTKIEQHMEKHQHAKSNPACFPTLTLKSQMGKVEH